ncbi:hypothetical protein TRIP_B20012 [uncultured Desulfatiglans sp.]|uniref:Uncharacterized protein n=1 Tax=Uncultured Desulfatiglans sp. TaxID=1748965 RepID=A0A653A1E6_UNCDX|nr:hypothetical protein TRIP_B20012 [uncultured Desulfatiglans sp.]
MIFIQVLYWIFVTPLQSLHSYQLTES